MEIEMPFNDWSIKKLTSQTKKATSRTRKFGNVGDTFLCINGIQYIIDLVIKLPLWFIAEDLYRSEGATSVDEFIEQWKSIHPKRGYKPADEVWYHHFKEM